MTVSTEYNKVHALAQARRKVVSLLGNDLLHFWPLNDPEKIVRDLMRRKPLVSLGGISQQAPGILDYAVESDGADGSVVTDQSDQHDFGNGVADANYLEYTTIAVEIRLPGLFKEVQFVARSTATGGRYLQGFIVPKDESNALDSLSKIKEAAIAMTQRKTQTLYSDSDTTVTLPFGGYAEVPDDGAAYWLIIHQESGTGTPRFRQSTGRKQYDGSDVVVKYWSSSQWNDVATKGLYNAKLEEHDPANIYPAGTGELTIGAWVDPRKVYDKQYILKMGYVELWVEQNVAKSRFVNANNTTYQQDGSTVLHPGLNFVVATFKRLDKAILYLNGYEEDNDATADVALKDASANGDYLYVMASNKSGICYGIKGYGCDLFVAKKALTATDVLDLYKAYIAAIPLMLTEAQT